MVPRMVEKAESNGKSTKRGVVIDAAAPLILGFAAYSVAAVSTFSIPQLMHVGLDPLAVALVTNHIVSLRVCFASLRLHNHEDSDEVASFLQPGVTHDECANAHTGDRINCKNR